jgi:hypothetical protein
MAPGDATGFFLFFFKKLMQQVWLNASTGLVER